MSKKKKEEGEGSIRSGQGRTTKSGRKKFDGATAKRILQFIAAAGAGVGVGLVFAALPGLGMVVKEFADWYEESDALTRFRIRKTFAQLQRERFISARELKDGRTQIVLARQGEKKVLQYRFADLTIPRPHQWNGSWHFIIFDIPTRYRRERELWRAKLKQLGFYKLQRSVWICPFPCRDEIDFITEYLRISPFVRILEVRGFNGEPEMRHIFSLS